MGTGTQYFHVEGGHKLRGSLKPQGAKNEALQIIPACILTDQDVIIDNIPNILDVNNQLKLLEVLDCKVEYLTKSKIKINARNLNIERIHSKEFQVFSKKIRGSVVLLGALLGRFGKAYIPKPGGDKIGRRHLDAHFHGFKMLGAEIVYNGVEDSFYLEGKSLKGTFILMDEISVTGTANVVMAAVLTEGTTKIYNAACEPYVQQLCKMLIQMGANISGIGSNLLTIEGVKVLNGTTVTILPDFIEIGSFIGLAAMTQSEIFIEDANPKLLGLIPNTFEKLGVQMEFRDNGLFIPQQEIYEINNFMDGSIPTIYDSPWPGFTPDLLSIILTIAVQAKGSVLIHQKMFESRLFFVDKLIDMGAKIILCDPHRATVIGLAREYSLKGIVMTSPDIRAGVSLLIAALSASDVSIIKNIHQIDRGYQDIEGRLNAIGAKISRLVEE